MGFCDVVDDVVLAEGEHRRGQVCDVLAELVGYVPHEDVDDVGGDGTEAFVVPSSSRLQHQLLVGVHDPVVRADR